MISNEGVKVFFLIILSLSAEAYEFKEISCDTNVKVKGVDSLQFTLPREKSKILTIFGENGLRDIKILPWNGLDFKVINKEVKVIYKSDSYRGFKLIYKSSNKQKNMISCSRG